MKTYHSQFDTNKTYNTKTLSLDGSKIVREENTKYLFGFRENSQSQVEQFFFDKTYMKYFKEKGITFQDKLKKDINNKTCRYILCETEVISYDTDGVEFSRETSLQQYDKTGDLFHYQKGKKVSVKPQQERTRSFSAVRKIDNSGNERTVLVPGGIHYGVVPGTLKDKHLSMLGYITMVEVKMIDSLEII
jgi:hypothetical protein